MKRFAASYGSKPQMSSADFKAALKDHGFRVVRAKIEDATGKCPGVSWSAVLRGRQRLITTKHSQRSSPAVTPSLRDAGSFKSKESRSEAIPECSSGGCRSGGWGTFPRGSRLSDALRLKDSMNKAFTFPQVATGILPSEHGENGPTATRLAADPHLTRLALDNVEWWDRLARLAELRRGGQ
jgi:hypothetical protein